MSVSDQEPTNEKKFAEEQQEIASGLLVGDDAMTSAASDPFRRISAELRGDDAVEADMLETMLRIQEMARTKVERDSMLVQLAIKALGRVVSDCRQATGKRFPAIQDVADFLNQ